MAHDMHIYDKLGDDVRLTPLISSRQQGGEGELEWGERRHYVVFDLLWV